MYRLKICKILWIIFCFSSLSADGSIEIMFIRPDAPKIWQKSIGFFVQTYGDSILTVYKKPGKVLFSVNSEDTILCPLSAIGYLGKPLKLTSRKYPLLKIKGEFAKIVYNINKGLTGWVKIKDKKRKIMLFSDSLKFRGMDVLYLGTMNKKKSDTVFYYDKPNGKITGTKIIHPFIPKMDTQRFGYKNKKHFRKVWHYYRYNISLGVVLKIKGDWVLVGKFIYDDYKIEKKGWIRLRDKKGNLLLWLIWVDRC